MKEENTPPPELHARMMMVGGVLDGEYLSVKYDDPDKKILPPRILVPIKRKVIVPAYMAKQPAYESYTLRSIPVERTVFYMYILTSLRTTEFFRMLLESYSPEARNSEEGSGIQARHKGAS